MSNENNYYLCSVCQESYYLYEMDECSECNSLVCDNCIEKFVTSRISY